MQISRALLRSFLALLLLPALVSQAQTYTPRHIVVDGPAGMDKADILHTAGLTDGTPLTKEQIETALGHLAETGDFTDLSYSVNSDALTLKLTPSPSKQSLPVRYTNFVWWKPGELTPLIQQRVPLYQGKLPLTGNLTDQVEAALVAMLKEKGIDASVTVVEAMGGGGIALAISRPEIVLGHITVENTLPDVAAKLSQMQAGFNGQEFDQQELSRAIPINVTDLYDNAGFLDAATGPATFAAPHKDSMDRYVIDATATVTPGTLYRIRQITFDAPPPLSQKDLAKAAGIKATDPAGALTIEHAADSLDNAYRQRGYLESKTSRAYPKDSTTHTVDVTFTTVPGDIYHLAAVNASSLPPDARSALASNPRLAPGVVADQDVSLEIQRTLAEQHLGKPTRTAMAMDRQHHLATYTVTLAGSTR